MKIVKLIKDNWKALLFSYIYIIGVVFSIGLAGMLSDYVKGNESLLSIMLLMITALAFASLIAQYFLKKIFKEKAYEITNKSSVILLAVGLICVLVSVISISGTFIGKFSFNNELEKVMLFFLVPTLFALLLVMFVGGLIITFILFGMLRIAVKHTKSVAIILIISISLYILTLTNIYLPFNISIGNINKKEEILKDVLSMQQKAYQIYRYQNTYFIHNDKIYSTISHNKNYNNGRDELFCIDLDGNNKKVISNSEQLQYAQFIYADGNEAYYYTTYVNCINKINLETGEIETIYKFSNKTDWWYVHYHEAEEKFYEIFPKYKNSEKYKLEDYIYECNEPKDITVINTQTGKKMKYNNSIYARISDNILYMICAEKIDKDLYILTDNLKNIQVKKIVLQH